MEQNYIPRSQNKISISTTEPFEMMTLDWFECDLNTDSNSDYNTHFLNQEHNKLYTIFVFGVTTQGYSVCLRINNYTPYFYIQIPTEFNVEQVQQFYNQFDISGCEDLDEADLEYYQECVDNKRFTDLENIRFKTKYYKSSISFNNTQIVEKKIFWTFMNEQKFKFIKLAHKSLNGMKFMEKYFKKPIKLPIKGLNNKEIKYNLFESDLEPVLSFLHDSKHKPSSWLHIDGKKYKIEQYQSKCQINISVNWNDIKPIEKTEVPPLVIASFDIEADSSHGDFPLPKKDCKKLANQLVVAWIREQRIIEKKQFKKFNIEKLNLPEHLFANEKGQCKNNTLTHLAYVKEVEIYCNQLYEQYKESNTNLISKEYQYLREILKYNTAVSRVQEKHKFFDLRIKQSLKHYLIDSHIDIIDDEIDKIYLKKPDLARRFIQSNEYQMMTNKIFTICNHSIRKVKANMIMKKAQKDVEYIETEKIKQNPNFQLTDLVTIIHQVAKKNGILEKDLQDKMITKEVMVRFINIELNKAFGHAIGDQVIQIGTVFWKYGEPSVNHYNIITLNNADTFNIGNKECEVICKKKEYDVLTAWTELIHKHDPDIIIGYNTFGFDMSFMYDRILDLCLDNEKTTLSKEDLKKLDTLDKYQKFINLGRLDERIVKKVLDAKGGIINKQLSSSALGDNFLYYFNMPGRVQIDLLKVCQASLTKLPSYKLDDVAEFYISGKVKDIYDIGNILKVDNINELQIGNYIVISQTSTTAKLFDGDKLKILDIDKENNKIKINKEIDKSYLGSGLQWGLGKDDITPQDIFKLQKGSNADRATIAKYCIQDCELLIRLLKKLEVCANNFGMSNVCLVPFSYIFLRGQGIKAFSLITNECSKEDFLLPLLERVESEEVSVDDSIRRMHTRNNNIDNGEDDDINEIEEESNNIEDVDDSIEDDEPKSRTFQLKKDFNKVYMTEDSYEGALVLKPVTDIYTEDPITVLDFSSLYPSEMITSDLSHDRICEDDYWLGEKGIEHLKSLGLSYLDRSYDNFEWINPKIKSKGKRKCGTTTVRFVQYPDGRKGLIPRILMGLLKSRKETKKRMEAETDPFKKVLLDGLQLAYKITANSVYGQIGAKTSKLYKPQIAASTTAGGRLMITKAMDFMKETYGNCKIVYSDTDSTFIKFKLLRPDGKPPENDLEKITLAIEVGQDAEKKIKKVLPGVHALAYEKVLFPFILISKKRYFALKYEDDPTKYKQLSMGLILKRRDNAPILKHCYIGVLDSLVKDKNIPKALQYIQNECKKMIDSKFDMNMFIISKTLSSYYKDPESIAHAVLAQRMAERDPGNKPQSNERIPYVFIKIDEEAGVEYLQGDRIEHAPYVKKYNLKIDYEKYILNQIMKPVSQLFELVVERLPNFPYGIGYYEQMYNIWYNKYEGDSLKTEKKIKQLKSQMVQKLVFQPLIEYAQMKISNTRTINEWFPSIGTTTEDTINKQKKQENHNITVKKTKQLSLDKYFS